MTHGLWPLLAWATEFVLESLGAWFAWSRRLRFLAIFLTFSAAADLVTFGVSRILGDYAYGVASWGAEAVSYALLCLLACQVAAHMARERKPIWYYAGFLSVLGSVISTVVFRNAPSWDGKFLDAEIAAGCYIGVLLLVAWVCQENKMAWPWRSIAWGVATVAVGNSLCAGLWRAHLAGPMLYFVPEILGLAILAWAGWRHYELEEYRRELPQNPVDILREFEQTVIRQLSERVN